MNPVGFWKYKDSNIPIEVGDLVFYGSSTPNNYPPNAKVICLGDCCASCETNLFVIERFDGEGNLHRHHNNNPSAWYVYPTNIKLVSKPIRYTPRGNLLALTL